MINASHHKVIYPLFQHLTRHLMRRHFEKVEIVGEAPPQGAVLVLANHISWWDGFWMMHLNLHSLHRKIHFMMLEEQLKKHWYFKYTGAFSVKKNSRGVLKSIQYTIDLLKDEDNMVFVFPQGKIHSMHQHHIHFEQGVKRIVKQASDSVNILFVANFVEYLSKAKPQLTIFTECYQGSELREGVAQEYQHFYTQCLEQQKKLKS